MYPSRFRYEAPRSIDEAIALLQDGGGEAKVLAGGQSLVPLLKLRFAAPELLVDINSLPGLAYHKVDADGTIRVGALCRHADLERSTVLAERQPTMAAVDSAICRAPSYPALPVKALALPLFTTRARAEPAGTWALHQSTGAEAVLDLVNTPATWVPGEKTANRTSVRSL